MISRWKKNPKNRIFEGVIPQIANFRAQSGKPLPSNPKKLGFYSKVILFLINAVFLVVLPSLLFDISFFNETKQDERSLLCYN